MHFTSFLEEGKLTVALTGEIDHHCAKEYIRLIAAKIEAYTTDICIFTAAFTRVKAKTKRL